MGQVQSLQRPDLTDGGGDGDDFVVPQFQARQPLQVLEADDLLDGSDAVGLQVKLLQVGQTENSVWNSLQLAVVQLQLDQIDHLLQTIEDQQFGPIVVHHQLNQMRRQLRDVCGHLREVALQA